MKVGVRRPELAEDVGVVPICDIRADQRDQRHEAEENAGKLQHVNLRPMGLDNKSALNSIQDDFAICRLLAIAAATTLACLKSIPSVRACAPSAPPAGDRASASVRRPPRR